MRVGVFGLQRHGLLMALDRLGEFIEVLVGEREICGLLASSAWAASKHSRAAGQSSCICCTNPSSRWAGSSAGSASNAERKCASACASSPCSRQRWPSCSGVKVGESGPDMPAL